MPRFTGTSVFVTTLSYNNWISLFLCGISCQVGSRYFITGQMELINNTGQKEQGVSNVMPVDASKGPLPSFQNSINVNDSVTKSKFQLAVIFLLIKLFIQVKCALRDSGEAARGSMPLTFLVSFYSLRLLFYEQKKNYWQINLSCGIINKLKIIL